MEELVVDRLKDNFRCATSVEPRERPGAQMVESVSTALVKSSPASAARAGRGRPANKRSPVSFSTSLNFCQVDECAEAPCLNEGHCIDLLGDFSCSCPLTWTGRRCEERVER